MSSSKNLPSKRRREARVQLVVDALDKFATTVRSWSAEDLAGFLSGRLELGLHPTGPPLQKADRMPTAPVPEDVDAVRRALLAMTSREEGFEYLDQLRLNRLSLRRLAAALHLPVNQPDTVDQVRTRIIQAPIAYRL